MKMMKKTSLSDVNRRAEGYARRMGFCKRDFVDFEIVVMAFKAGYRSAKREKDGKV